MIADVRDWAGHLRAAAGPVVAGAPADAAGFRDELGQRREVDGPFMAWRETRETGASAWRPSGALKEIDARLWWALARGAGDAGAELGALRDGDARGGGAQPLLDLHAVQTMEVWTQTHLCAMHAAWRLGARPGCDAWRARCSGAARWMIEHIQPDNATNRPWGIHVFVLLGARERLADATWYGETLLHNCRVAMGRPDCLSAHVLIDAAECLEEALARGGGELRR